MHKNAAFLIPLFLSGCMLAEPTPAWVAVSPGEALSPPEEAEDAWAPGGGSPAPLSVNEFRRSATPADRPLTLQGAVALALAGNRDFRLARYGPVIAAADLSEAQAVYDPEAFAASEFRYDGDRRYGYLIGDYNRDAFINTERAGLRQRTPTGADVSAYQEWHHGRESGGGQPTQKASDTATVLEVAQPLLLNRGDRENRDNIRVMRIRAEQSDEEFRRAAIDAVAGAAQTYWQLARARDNLRIGRENLALAQDVLNREMSRAETRVATALDVERAREAVASRTVECSRAEEACEIQNERLKLILNAPKARAGSDAQFVPVDPPAFQEEAFDEAEAYRIALATRPEVRRLRLEVESARVRREYARHTRLPRLDLTGRLRGNFQGYGNAVGGDSRDDYGTDYSVGLLFSVPLGQVRSKALQERALAEWQRSNEQVAQIEEQTLAEMRVALRSLALAAAEAPAAEEAVAAALKVIEGERAKLELNPAGNLDLLRAHDVYAAAARRRVDAHVQYRLARLTLEQTQGTLLEHLGVRLEKSPFNL